jgi:hypothetical protein
MWADFAGQNARIEIIDENNAGFGHLLVDDIYFSDVPKESRTKMKTDQQQETGPWDAALGQLRDWDQKWAETCMNMSTKSVDLGRFSLARPSN